MAKLLYLFELDPALNTKKEVESAHKVLFNEINKFNKIILTPDQFLDSKVILSIYNNEICKNNITKLINYGIIRCCYKYDKLDLKKYFLKVLDNYYKNKNSSLFFYNLPIKKNDKLLYKNIKISLQKNDTTNIDLLINNSKIKFKKMKELKKRIILKERIKDLEQVKKYLDNIIYLSKLNIKIDTLKEGKKYKLVDYINSIINYYNDKDISDEFNYALNILKNINEESNDVNKRNYWYKHTKNKLSRLIIDLSYNYMVQNTIKGISRNYNNFASKSFYNDFEKRLNNFYNIKTDYKNEFDYNLNIIDIPNWKHLTNVFNIKTNPKKEKINKTKQINTKTKKVIKSNNYQIYSLRSIVIKAIASAIAFIYIIKLCYVDDLFNRIF